MSANEETTPSIEGLPRPQYPPSAADWNHYRPFISHLYQNKQETARLVVQELRRHDFIATYVLHVQW